MLRWLLPKERNFFDFFEKHIEICVQAAEELMRFLEGDRSSLQSLKTIFDLEHEADHITHACIESLHKTFITPFERNDIYRLISKMDDIADNIKEIVARFSTYKIITTTPSVKKLAKLLHCCTLSLETAVHGLSDLKNSDSMKKAFSEIAKIESEADAVLREALGTLFDKEKDAINIIKWKEIYEHIEEAINCCEDASNIIEGVILEAD